MEQDLRKIAEFRISPHGRCGFKPHLQGNCVSPNGDKSNSRANAKSAEGAGIRVIIGVELHEKGQLSF